MIIKSAKFVDSVANADKLPQFTLPQYAFVGRSNVGKSSLINALCARTKLAKTSSTPGRTRLINFFNVNDALYLVDLPGYGFALASKNEQAQWQSLIGGYLNNTTQLRLVFVLVDIRHEPTDKDVQMLEYLYTFAIPFKVIATKADKIARGQIAKQISIIASKLGIGTDDIIAVSSEKHTGLDNVWRIIENIGE